MSARTRRRQKKIAIKAYRERYTEVRQKLAALLKDGQVIMEQTLILWNGGEANGVMQVSPGVTLNAQAQYQLVLRDEEFVNIVIPMPLPVYKFYEDVDFKVDVSQSD